ncbi:unnamed protein product [Arctia plantaginis]|uniref:Uncharacterized protein n=1 Tax=Arctia plantaginis TaxID=874455 RepID=A0A8S1AGF4_ARCPL|nr:unnamed protein product [Arctia plantaginis]
MNEVDNVTVRRARAHSNSDLYLDESCINRTLDGTVCSMPDMSEDEDTDLIIKLKKQIDDLTTKLCSANGEVDLLTLENDKLRKENEILTRKNSLYKQIASSPIQSPTNTPNKKRTTISKQVGCKNVQTQTNSNIDTTENVAKTCGEQKNTHSSPQMAPQVACPYLRYRPVKSFQKPCWTHNLLQVQWFNKKVQQVHKKKKKRFSQKSVIFYKEKLGV